MPSSTVSSSQYVKTFLIAGLVAGTLDISAAILILAGGKAAATLRFVASGVFGKAAFEGGAGMAAWGAVFHYFTAICFAAAYGLVYPRLPFLQKQPVVSGILYGILVWTIMNLVVVPLSQAPHGPFQLVSVAKNMAILIICIGLPIALITRRLRSVEVSSAEARGR